MKDHPGSEERGGECRNGGRAVDPQSQGIWSRRKPLSAPTPGSKHSKLVYVMEVKSYIQRINCNLIYVK